MIDFALDGERRRQLPAEEAIYQACILRFRPIMMTTMAALLGGLPLALGTGAGSELRRPLGIAIVGGLLLSQFLTLYTTPVIYIYLSRFGHLRWFWRRKAGPEILMPDAGAAPVTDIGPDIRPESLPRRYEKPGIVRQN